MNSHLTALSRGQTPSRPVRVIAKLIPSGREVLHFGCGKDAAGTRILAAAVGKHGHVAEYDPTFAPHEENLARAWDVVVCVFVLNTLEPEPRHAVVEQIAGLLSEHGTAFFAVRGMRDGISGEPHADGFVTKRGTFQHPFTPAGLLSTLRAGGFPHFRIVTPRPFVLVEAWNR